MKLLPRCIVAIALLCGTLQSPLMAADLAVVGNEDLSIHALQVAERAATGLAFLGHEPSPLWRGYGLRQIPLILHEPGGVAFLLNHGAPYPSGFQPLKGQPDVGIQFHSRGYRRGINIDVPFNGKKAVTVSFSDRDGADRVLTTAVHEAFHQYQRTRGFRTKGASTDLAMNSPRDMALVEIEQTLLANALDATDDRKARQAARMFLAVRSARHAALPAAVENTENQLETIEGTAKYVETQMAISVWESRPRPAVTFGRSKAAVVADVSFDLRRPPSDSDYARGRYYQTGAAMGLLLDRWLPAWQSQAEQGASPSDLLARACPVNPADAKRLWNDLTTTFDLEAVTRRYTSRFEDIRERQAAILQQFNRSNGHRVTVEIAFEHGGISVSSSGEKFNVAKLGEYYESATIAVEGQNGLSLELRGEMLSGHAEGHYRYSLFEGIEPGQITLDGYPIALSPGTWGGALKVTTPKMTINCPAALVERGDKSIRIRL